MNYCKINQTRYTQYSIFMYIYICIYWDPESNQSYPLVSSNIADTYPVVVGCSWENHRTKRVGGPASQCLIAAGYGQEVH